MQQNEKIDWENWENLGMLEGLSKEEAAECSVFLNNTFSLLQRYKEYEPKMKIEYRNSLAAAREFYLKIRKVYSKDFLEIADSMYYKNTCLHSTKLTGIRSFDSTSGRMIKYNEFGRAVFAYSELDAELDWVITFTDIVVKDFIKKIEHKQMFRHFCGRPRIKKMYLHSVWISPLAGPSDYLGVGFNGAFVE